MRKTTLAMLLAMSGAAFAQKPIKVQGTIKGEPDVNKVYMLPQGADDQEVHIDSFEVKKGKFSFTKNYNDITRAVISRYVDGSLRYAEVLLVPGEKLKLTLKGNEYFYGGSKIYKEMDAADRAVTPAYQDLQDYHTKAFDIVNNTPEDKREALIPLLNDTLEMKLKHYEETSNNYLDSHLDSEGALLYLLNNTGAEDLQEKLSDKNPQMLNTRTGKYIAQQVEEQKKALEEQERQQEEELAKLDALKGQPAPEFTLNDINGKPLSLKSLRGKYVILDFWGSWCGWCIKGFPDMKKYYEKYAGKFEILGIDCNDTQEVWKKAVEQHELPWLHVYNPNSSTVLKDYGVKGFPTKIIIDSEGNYNKIIVGESPDFYTYLDELFSK